MIFVSRVHAQRTNRVASDYGTFQQQKKKELREREKKKKNPQKLDDLEAK